MKKTFTQGLSLALILVLTACASTEQSQLDETSTPTTSATEQESNTQAVATTSETNEMFTARDQDSTYDASSATHITLANESVTIDQEGVYVLSGTLTDSQVIIDVADTQKVQLVLDNVNITATNTAPIYVKSANKVFVTLAEGSTNTLQTTESFVADGENNVDGVIFAKSDLTFNGTGALIINAAQGHGIVGKDDVVFTGGTYTVTAANHGVAANNSVRIADGALQIESGKDGIQVEHLEDSEKGFFYMENGNLAVVAAGDAISTSGILQIEGGMYTLTTGNGAESVALQSSGMMPGGMSAQQTTTSTDTASQKGLKSEREILINDGEFTIDTVDDSIHSGGDLTIETGNFSLKSGDDAIHADANVMLEGGDFYIPYAYEGIEGLAITVNGGNYEMITTDDGFNAAGGVDGSGVSSDDPFATTEGAAITINDGTIKVVSDGDSIDSNGTLTINGGTLNLTCNGNGNTAIDVNGTYTNNGGDVTTNDGSENGTQMGGPRPGSMRP